MCTRCSFVRGLGAVVALPLATGPIAASARTGDPQALEIAFPGMRRVSDTVWLGRLTPTVWVHTTTHVIDGDLCYPANGAIVVRGSRSLLIDAGWTGDQAETIVSEWERLKMPPIDRAVVTHFHYDRLGGAGALAKRGIPAYANPLTIGLAIDNGFPVPKPIHDLERHPARIGEVEIFYPGGGHTIDNIVAWVPRDRVLFGGCLVKSTTAPDLGNLADAEPGAYEATVKRVARRYAASHVIPGHGTIAGDSLGHTAHLAGRLRRS